MTDARGPFALNFLTSCPAPVKLKEQDCSPLTQQVCWDPRKVVPVTTLVVSWYSSALCHAPLWHETKINECWIKVVITVVLSDYVFSDLLS